MLLNLQTLKNKKIFLHFILLTELSNPNVSNIRKNIKDQIVAPGIVANASGYTTNTRLLKKKLKINFIYLPRTFLGNIIYRFSTFTRHIAKDRENYKTSQKTFLLNYLIYILNYLIIALLHNLLCLLIMHQNIHYYEIDYRKNKPLIRF